jgi:hypothetical protein
MSCVQMYLIKKMAHARQPFLITLMVFYLWWTDVQICDPFFLVHQNSVHQKQCVLSARVPISPLLLSLSPKGSEQHLSLWRYLMSLLVACVFVWFILLNLPLFLLLLCVFLFANFLACLRLTYRRVFIYQYLLMTDVLSEFSCTPRRQALAPHTSEGVLQGMQLLFVGPWLALKKCVVALLPIDWLPGLGFLARPLKDLLLVGLGGLWSVCCKCASPAWKVGHLLSSRGLQAQALERSLLWLGPRGPSLAT